MTTAAPAVDEVRFRGQPAVRVDRRRPRGDVPARARDDRGLAALRRPRAPRPARRPGRAAVGGHARAPAPRPVGQPPRAAAATGPPASTSTSTACRSAPTATGCRSTACSWAGRGGGSVAARPVPAGRASAPPSTSTRPAFPFPHRIELAVTARERRLTIDTTVVPDRVAGGPDRLRMAPLPAVARHAATALVPAAAGPHPPRARRPGHPDRWRAGRGGARPIRSVGARSTTSTGSGASRDLALVADDAAISMRAGAGYPYAQVWVPAGRPFAALEPMTAADEQPRRRHGAARRARRLVLGGVRPRRSKDRHDEGIPTMSTPDSQRLGGDRRRRLRRRGLRQGARQARRGGHPARPPQLPPVPAAAVPGGDGRAGAHRHRPPAARHLRQGGHGRRQAARR